MSINSNFLTQRKTVCTPAKGTIGDGYAKVVSAAAQISNLGKTIVLKGSRRSGKSSFVLNQLKKDSRIPPQILKYRISGSKGRQAANVSFLMTDDERIPHEALILCAVAAKPTRALLDDDGLFFYRIFYDLSRYGLTHTLQIEDIDEETIRTSIAKSIDGYFASFENNSLAQWISSDDDNLLDGLAAETKKLLSDKKVATAVKIIFKQSESDRNNQLLNSEHSFAGYYRYCLSNHTMNESVSSLWKVIIELLETQLEDFCSSCTEGLDGCYCIDEPDVVRLIMVTADSDESVEMFAAHPTAQRITGKFYLNGANKNGNRLVSENYFSNIQFILRMSPELVEELKDQVNYDLLTVARVNDRSIHAIRFVEAGSQNSQDGINELDNVVKLYSAIGVIVFGANDEFSAQPELFEDVSRVLREGVAPLPITFVGTKKEQDIISCLVEDELLAKLSLEKLVSREKELKQDAELAGKRELTSYECRIFNEFKKNKNKVHPTVSGYYSSGMPLTFPASKQYQKAAKEMGMRDCTSPKFIAEVIASVFNNCKSKRIAVSSKALSANFTDFSVDGLTITPNIFSTISASYCGRVNINSRIEGNIFENWLNFGEKFNDDCFADGELENATFINSLRSIYRTYLKKYIVVSADVVSKVTDNPEELFNLLDKTVQRELERYLSKAVGRYCYDRSCNTIESNATERFETAINVLSADFFHSDELEVSMETTFGGIISLALNDCVHSVIRKNCYILY